MDNTRRLSYTKGVYIFYTSFSIPAEVDKVHATAALTAVIKYLEVRMALVNSLPTKKHAELPSMQELRITLIL